MTAAWLMRRHARQRRAAMLALAVIVALGATATFVAAGAADRTGGAYARYLDRADVSDVVINPSLSTTEIDRVIRDLPGVRAVTTDALFLGTLNDDGHPRPRSEFDELTRRAPGAGLGRRPLPGHGPTGAGGGPPPDRLARGAGRGRYRRGARHRRG